jgi:hypothetical protein
MKSVPRETEREEGGGREGDTQLVEHMSRGKDNERVCTSIGLWQRGHTTCPSATCA